MTWPNLWITPKNYHPKLCSKLDDVHRWWILGDLYFYFAHFSLEVRKMFPSITSGWRWRWWWRWNLTVVATPNKNNKRLRHSSITLGVSERERKKSMAWNYGMRREKVQSSMASVCMHKCVSNVSEYIWNNFLSRHTRNVSAR